MRTLIATQDDQIERVDVVDINRLVIYPERNTSDDPETGDTNHWALYAHLYVGTIVKLFEARDFDNKNEFFYAFEAVKGKNYERVSKAKERAEQAMVDANQMVALVRL